MPSEKARYMYTQRTGRDTTCQAVIHTEKRVRRIFSLKGSARGEKQ